MLVFFIKRFMRFSLLVFISVFMVGCSSIMNMTYERDDKTRVSFDDFQKGSAVLGNGDFGNLRNLEGLVGLNENKNYLAAAYYNLNYFPSHSLTYFQLGFSAEKMGFYHAARAYYLRSKKDKEKILSQWCDGKYGRKNNEWVYLDVCNWYKPDVRLSKVEDKLEKYGEKSDIVIGDSEYIALQIAIAEDTAIADQEFRKDFSIFKEPEVVSAYNDFKDDLKKVLPLIILGAAIPDNNDSSETRALKRSVFEFFSPYKTPQSTGVNLYGQGNQISLERFRTDFSNSGLEPLKAIPSGFSVQRPVQPQGTCECACINGNVQAICKSYYDIKPVCPTTTCPVVNPSVKPINHPVVPPAGTSSCTMYQVFNNRSNGYDWRRLCR